MESTPAYQEKQRFRQRWHWALLIGVAVLILFLGPIAWVGLAIVGGVAAFLYSLRLRTEVREDGIYIQLWPIHRTFRQISWDEIEQYEDRTYSPLREFSGWGIRWAPGKLAYTGSGERGVLIQRTNGRSILVGSQQPAGFRRAIDEHYER